MKKFYSITNKSFAELGVANTKELWDKVKGEYSGLCKGVQSEFAIIKGDDGQETNRFNVIMSTASQDRHGEIVVQDWELDSFKKNPVFLDSHNYGSIEHIIGKFVEVGLVDGALKGVVEFFLDNPKGMLAYKAAKQGFLNATSVGFIPKAFDNDGNILKSELLENSAVSVPANAEALFEKGIEEAIADVKLPEEEVEEVIEEQKPVDKVDAPSDNIEKSLISKINDELSRTDAKQKTVLLKILEGVNSKGSPEKRNRKILSQIRDLV